MIDINALASKAAAQWRTLPDRSLLRFYNITKQVAKGTGVTNSTNLTRITREVRQVARRSFAMIPNKG